MATAEQGIASAAGGNDLGEGLGSAEVDEGKKTEVDDSKAAEEPQQTCADAAGGEEPAQAKAVTSEESDDNDDDRESKRKMKYHRKDHRMLKVVDYDLLCDGCEEPLQLPWYLKIPFLPFLLIGFLIPGGIAKGVGMTCVSDAMRKGLSVRDGQITFL